MRAVRSLIRQLAQINLFPDARTVQDPNPKVLRDQILTTRIYVLLVAATLLILVLFTSLSGKTSSLTIVNPSLAIYEKLQTAYPNTLVCSCRQAALPHEEFLSIAPVYHQVNISKATRPTISDGRKIVMILRTSHTTHGISSKRTDRVFFFVLKCQRLQRNRKRLDRVSLLG